MIDFNIKEPHVDICQKVKSSQWFPDQSRVHNIPKETEPMKEYEEKKHRLRRWKSINNFKFLIFR